MGTFKRIALVAVLAIAGAGATAQAASAVTVTVNGSTTTNKNVVLTAGTTKFVASFVTVTCTTSNLTFNLANNTSGNPAATVSGPATLTFTGCSSNLGGATTVSCTGVVMNQTSTTAGNIVLSNRECTISLAGGACTIRTPDTGTKTVNFTWSNVGQTATVAPQSLLYTTSGGLGCLGINSGTATWSNPTGGNVVYTVSGGDVVNVS